VSDVGALVTAAGSGDQAAWDQLVARYSSLLWSVARGYRLGGADAADAIQTTWLRLVEHLHRIEDPERLAGWLVTTLRRECLRLIRRSGRERPMDDDAMPDVPDDSDPLDSGLLLAERDAALWRTFEAMPPRCQRLLRVLMASPPPSYADVSAALDMPVGSIGPTRQRCLDHLRKLVDGNNVLSDPASRRGTP